MSIDLNDHTLGVGNNFGLIFKCNNIIVVSHKKYIHIYINCCHANPEYYFVFPKPNLTALVHTSWRQFWIHLQTLQWSKPAGLLCKGQKRTYTQSEFYWIIVRYTHTCCFWRFCAQTRFTSTTHSHLCHFHVSNW